MLIMENKSSSPLTSNSSFAEIINIITHLSMNVPYFGFNQWAHTYLLICVFDFFFPYWQNTGTFPGFPLPFALLCVLCNLFCLIDGYLGGFQVVGCYKQGWLNIPLKILAHVGKDIYWLHLLMK